MMRLAALLLGVSCAACAAEIPPLPVSQWHVEAKPGDQAVLAAKDGCLAIDFNADIKDFHQQGHQSFKQTQIRLLLNEPRPLASSETRLLIEAMGISPAPYRGSCGVQLAPLVRDASGETLRYYMKPLPHLKSGTANWSGWTTAAFQTSEAGGATQDIYEAEGGDANAWPDGQLAFVGFDLILRSEQFEHRKGSLAIGAIATCGVKLPAAAPFAYADAFLDKKGSYKFAVKVANAFQSQSLREFTQNLDFDPADLASRKRKLEIPLGPDDNYWISYQISSADGALVANNSFRTQIEGSAEKAYPAPVPMTQEPVIGNLRVNPDVHAGGVYKRDEPMDVTVRVFPKGAKGLTLAWSLLQYAFDTPLENGKETVVFTGEPFKDVVIKLKPEAGRDVYRLKLDVTDAGKLVDSQLYVLGRATDFSQPLRTRQGKILDRDYVKKSAYFRVTYFNPNEKDVKSEDEAVEHFGKMLDEASQMTRYITYMLPVEDFEMLPGVFDFALLDKLMDAAADRGCALTIRLCVGFEPSSGKDFTYLRYCRQRNYDGTPILYHIYGGGFSLSDQDYVDAWLRAFKALHDRYELHPGFQGYYVMQPCGETIVADKPWEGQVAGYEKSSVPAFRKYLKETRGLSLERLNARWGTKLGSWDEVFPPLPDFSAGKAPDLRPQWLDFNLFKDNLGASWFKLANRYIRSFDKNHVIIDYSFVNDSLSEQPDYYHNGGNHFLQGEGKLVKAWEKGTGWITEPHHPHGWAAYGDPGERGWVLDWSTYVMTAQAGGGGANLHVYYMPCGPIADNPLYLPSHYGRWYAYDRFERFKPILRELYSMKLVETPKAVAVMQDPYTLYCKHRTTFGPREDDLRRWFELLKLDAVPYEDFDKSASANYKLILPNIFDEVMSKENIDACAAAVRGGAKMIVTANTGRYCPELPGQAFPLLKALGVDAPEGPYCTDAKEAKASVAAANPLFAKGDDIQFYTLRKLQDELQSPAVREGFWKWPYRWIPQTDYFGFFRDNQRTNGEVLARFASGGVALSLHNLGKGEILVFWGTPDYKPELLKGMMARAAAWAGVENPNAGNPIPKMLEGSSSKLQRNYALLYEEKAGDYRQRLPHTPDGSFFIDDLVSGERLGLHQGKDLRQVGIKLHYSDGSSPLKVLRMIPESQMQTKWTGKYLAE